MIVGWRNPLTGRFHDLDDVAMWRVMPGPMLDYMVRKERGDTRHSGTNITATAPMGCIRQFAINRMLDTRPDPEKMWPMTGGTILHEQFGIEFANATWEGEPYWYTEEMNPEKCTFETEMFGVQMGVKLDLISRSCFGEGPGPKAISDFKTSFNGSHKWIDQLRKAKVNHAIQLNTGRMIVEKALGLDLSDCELSAWIVSGAWKQTFAEHMSEEDIMKCEVNNTKFTETPYTYATLFGDLKKFVQLWEDAAKREGCDPVDVSEETKKLIISQMPLYGRQMFNKNPKYQGGGNLCTDYCPVRWECDNIDL